MKHLPKFFAAGFLITAAFAAGRGRLRADESPGLAPQAGEKRGDSAAQVPPPSDPHHAERCAGCSAEAVWIGFLDHLRDLHREDLIPENLLPRESKEERGDLQLDLLRSDPILGLLFRMSPELIQLDATFQEAHGEPLGPERLEAARGRAAKLLQSSDKYLSAYGAFYGARLDIEAKECAAGVKALEGLVKSCYFLPRREARRYLAQAYACQGDDTLALLELQYFLIDLAPEQEADSIWAKDELKKIRDRKHPGPLHHSEEGMRSISELLAGHEVGDPTQSKERRVEDVIEKVTDLLQRKAGMCASGAACPRVVTVLVPGQGEQVASGEGKKKGRKNRNGEQQPEEGDKAASKTRLNQEDSGEDKLRDASPDEAEVWGRINDREVARSLRELWDKIPRSYRLMVSQYFKDLSDPEPAKAGSGK